MLAVSSMVMTVGFNWNLFFLLWGVTALSGLLVLPYALTQQASAIQQMPAQKMSKGMLIAIQVAQQLILAGIAVGIGMLLVSRIGMDLPIFTGLIKGQALPANMGWLLLLSAGLGLVSGLFIIISDHFLFKPAMEKKLATLGVSMPENFHPPAWQGFLASFYGGIAEEVLNRLFLLTVFAWLGHFVSQTADGQPTLLALWIATGLAAVLFGLGHLPGTKASGIPLEGIVIARALILNGIPGVILGWLFWQHGLIFAMIAHFLADIVIHVIAQLIIKE